MGHSENLRSYLNMTRKELQQLCKKHNIPANRSHAFLAKSLASLYKKKNIKSAFSEEEKLSPSLSSKRKVTEKTPSMEKTQGSYARLLPSEGNIHNQLKFFCTTSSEKPQINMNVVHPSTGNNRSSNSSTSNLGNLGENYPDAAVQKTNANQLIGFVGNEFGRRNECKRSSQPENSNQFLQNAFTVGRTCNNAVAQCGHNEVIKCSTESGIRSASETYTKTPSFQFFVMSEAGINLYVDLESNPIEWINSLKDEVCIHQKGGNHESSAHTCGLPHADDNVENLPSGDTRMELQSNEVEQNPGCTNSTLSSVVSENGNSEAYPPDVTIATSGSSVLIPGNPPVDFGCLEENQAVSSSHYAHLAHENLTTDIARGHGGVVCVHKCNDASTGVAKSDASLCDTPLKAISNVDDATIDCPTKTTCSDYGDVEASALSNSSHYMSAKSNLSDELKNSLENYHAGSIKNQNGVVEELISKSPMSEKRDKECTHGASSNLCQFASHNVLDGATTNAQSEGCSTPTRGKDSEGARAESSLNNNCKRSITSEILKELPSKRHKMSCENLNGTLVHLKVTKNLAKETISDAVVNPRRSTRLVPKVFFLDDFTLDDDHNLYTTNCAQLLERIGRTILCLLSDPTTQGFHVKFETEEDAKSNSFLIRMKENIDIPFKVHTIISCFCTA